MQYIAHPAYQCLHVGDLTDEGHPIVEAKPPAKRMRVEDAVCTALKPEEDEELLLCQEAAVSPLGTQDASSPVENS